jgi:toxin-antitoxin system PIN domain toxin
VLESERPYGLAESVLSGFISVVTHPRVFTRPTPLDRAFEFCEALRSPPHATVLSPGPRHWQIFAALCTETGARGNLVADAYLAALAIETRSEWITTDRDFSRFRGLRSRHPLADS